MRGIKTRWKVRESVGVLCFHPPVSGKLVGCPKTVKASV